MSDIIYVSTTEELYDALATCTGGETILLEGGEYGDFILNGKSGFDYTYPENVTIASADPDNPAVFSTMAVHEAENITFDGIYFDYTFSSNDNYYYKPFQIIESSNVTVVNCTFDGDIAEGVSEIDDGYGWAYGLWVYDSTDIVIENNEVFGFMRGMLFSDTSDLDVIGNDVHSVRMDGMTFSNVDNVLISENYIHDFSGNPESGDHCDMIQFWTNGDDSPSTNIIIENNVLDIGDGTPAQSIFMGNEEVDYGAGEEMYYQNVTITENIIVNGHSHGITVNETIGLLIENNTVVHADGANDDGLDEGVEIPQINVAEDAINVTISQNITGGVNGDIGQEDWIVTENVIVQDQDPNGENYYGDVFITSTLAPEDGVHAYVAVPGGVIEQAGAGAAATLSPEIDGVIEAHFQIAATPDNAAVRHFDAGLTLTSLDTLPEGTTYSWDFGDGTTATGLQVSHAFPDGGVYPVTLTVALPDGTSDSQSFDVGIQGATLVSYSEGQVLAYDLGQPVSVAEIGAEGIEVPDLGAGLVISRDHFAELDGADDIEISLTIQADSTENSGEIVRLHTSFYMVVGEDGELTTIIHNPAGDQLVFTTSGAGLDDLDAHDIDVHLSGEMLEISVDDVVLATGTVPGGMAYPGSHDLTFGNPWDKDNYNGSVTALEISANADDFEAAAILPEEPVAEDPVIEEPIVEEPVTEEPVVEEPVVEEPVVEEPTHGNGNGNLSVMARIFEFLKSLLGLQSTTRAEVDDAEAATSEADKLALDDEDQSGTPESLAA